MDLSIIILSWNTRDLTRNCLRSIFANVKDISFEVIAVDNNSQDGSAEMIEQEFSQVKLIKNSENLGFAKGNNQGYKASRGEYVLFLNSDTIIPVSDFMSVIPAEAGIQNSKNNIDSRFRGNDNRESGNDNRESGNDNRESGNDNKNIEKSVLRKMVEAIKSPPAPLCKRGESHCPPFSKEGQGGFKIGALSPKLIYPDGRFQYEFYRKFPSLWQTFWLYLLPMSKLAYKIDFLKKRYLTDINPEKSHFVENINLPGTALLMPAKLCRELKGWDEGTFYWLEDVDLNLRIKKAGYKLYYFADAEIIHLGGASSALWDDFKKMYNFRKAYLYYFRKYKGGFQGFLVKWMFILNALIVSPILIILGIFKRRFWKKGIAALKFSWKFLCE